MKKRIIIGLILSFMALSACGTNTSNEKEADSISDVGVDAKIDSYNSVDEMEEDADCIVIGKKVKVSDTVCNRDSNGDFIGGYSLSEFTLSEVSKDKTGKLSEGDTIIVLENEVYDEKTGKTYHIADYTAMNTEDEYILYLSFNIFRDGQEYYTPLAAIYGTVCLGDDYKMKSYTREYGDEVYEYKDVNNLKEQIREEVLN